MSHASLNAQPEDSYGRIELDEPAAFPIYGRRRTNEEGQLRRNTSYPKPFTPFLSRDYYLKSGPHDKIEALQRMMGVLSRETPTDTIGGPFRQFLDWSHNLALTPEERDPNAQPQNMMFVLSGPGVGKTHLPKVIAKAFGYDHEMIGAGEAGGDIDELVIAHEFKGETAGDIAQKIEAKLAEEGASLTKHQMVAALKLRGFLTENPAALEESSRFRLNMDAIMCLPAKGAERAPGQEQQMETNIEALYAIAEKAGIHLKNESGIGVNKVNGRLLTKLLQVKAQYERSGKCEPVIITLDEFNRFRSFGKKLQNFWEVVGGASAEPVTLVDAAGIPNVFTPDMLRYVFVYMTGNDPKKVPGAKDLDYSMLDRIGENRVFRLEDFSAQDWQHRIEQQLLGIGIDLHWRAGGEEKGYWSAHRDEFTDHLLTKRPQGLTPAERHLYTPMQRELLQHWPQIHQGINQVAELFEYWADIYQQPAHRAEYNRMETKPSITPRMVNHMMNDIRALKVQGGSMEENMALLQRGKSEARDYLTAKNLGTKMVRFIREAVDKAHPDLDSGIRHELYKKMYELGLVSKEDAKRSMGNADLSEMLTTSNKERVEDLLNIDPERAYNKELRPLQAAIAEAIRGRFPEQADKDNDAIITLEQVAQAMASFSAKQQEALQTGSAENAAPAPFQQIILPKLALDEKGLHLDIIPTVIADALIRDDQLPDGERKRIIDALKTQSEIPGTLATTGELLLGFALPDGGAQLAHLFQPEAGAALLANRQDAMVMLREWASLQAPRANEQPLSETDLNASSAGSHHILAQHHQSGLAATVLHTVGHDGQRPEGERYFSDTVSVISYNGHDAQKDEPVVHALIVGFTPISSEITAYLSERRHITYICANEDNAANKLADALQDIVGAAKANLATSNSASPDLQETATHGLWHHLQQALNVRLPDTGSAEPAPEGGGNELELIGTRKSLIVNQLLDPKNLVAEHSMPAHVTTKSWQDLIASRADTFQSAAR